jgi:hypothetical protein
MLQKQTAMHMFESKHKLTAWDVKSLARRSRARGSCSTQIRSRDNKRGGESGRRGADEVFDRMRAGREKVKEYEKKRKVSLGNKMLPRWAGDGGGDAGKKRRLRRRKTAGIGEGERPAAAATSPRLLATHALIELFPFRRSLSSPPPSSASSPLFLRSVSLLSFPEATSSL